MWDGTSGLKFGDTPGADEQFQYCEVGLSQQACAVSPETSMEGACSNMSCTTVIEEECQQSRRLSYTTKFKREVLQCTEGGKKPPNSCNFWN
jgi:hypothetical protein